MLALFLVLGAVLSVAIPTQVFASDKEEEQANKAWDKSREGAAEGDQKQASKFGGKAVDKCGGGFIIVPGSGGEEIDCN